MDMDMNMDMSSTCSSSMFWNWNTNGTCFLAESWKVENDGMMAASCIGVFLMVILLEFLRRLGKEYDNFLLRRFKQHVACQSPPPKAPACNEVPAAPHKVTFRASPLQQLIRSVVHAVSFGVAYIVMLTAMSFNGYIIISIILGAGVGKFACDWMVLHATIADSSNETPPPKDDDVIETTMCCG
ncbi:putative high affinity copper protein [Xylariomycetidae sp. FL0641]|nr:putative high affinity copper protein [Xylariomycetidae sp. FL0641]